ncbi:MAG: tRNA (adenosine(37)-N6)-threonylcarbamoyltransferase complex ATPase subunit type 1 TsaE [Candidatus Peribacteraceae bacterium]|nr:tRNA (adenosine(37)-N6)-threonylcarbamoyltransferase complex ATPase subunit type 1 TsaE [Candidatus Peribacteraceae bacterium]
MSIVDRCTLRADNVDEMRKIGQSLARTIYVQPVTILLSGELGAGKTTFVQGLARGLGVLGSVVSPTFALEQRYGDILCHIDLYRLTSPAQAHDVLAHSHDFPGIRIIEWPERTTESIDAGICIKIEETARSSREIQCTFQDIAIPSEKEITQWMDEVMLPENVRLHTRAVAGVSDVIAQELISQGRIVRPRALHAAALGHDLLRFLNFRATVAGEPMATDEQLTVWERFRKNMPARHEDAAEQFYAMRRYPETGSIIATHQGKPEEMDIEKRTIEQLALAYADKRIMFDTRIRLDERFAYLKKRYGSGNGKQDYEERETAMEHVEKWLFPDGTPF